MKTILILLIILVNLACRKKQNQAPDYTGAYVQAATKFDSASIIVWQGETFPRFDDLPAFWTSSELAVINDANKIYAVCEGYITAFDLNTGVKLGSFPNAVNGGGSYHRQLFKRVSNSGEEFLWFQNVKPGGSWWGTFDAKNFIKLNEVREGRANKGVNSVWVDFNIGKLLHFYSDEADTLVTISSIDKVTTQETVLFTIDSLIKPYYVGNTGVNLVTFNGKDYCLVRMELSHKTLYQGYSQCYVKYNLTDGVLEKIEINNPLQNVRFLDGNVNNIINGFRGDEIGAFDIALDKIKWIFSIENSNFGGVAYGARINGDYIYLNTQAQVMKINRVTGNVEWINDHPSLRSDAISLVFYKDFLFTCGGNRVTCLRKSDGKVVWSTRSPANVKKGGQYNISDNDLRFTVDMIDVDLARNRLIVATGSQLIAYDVSFIK